MLMAFELSMPGCGSWNGQWTGEGRPYVRVENVTKKRDVKPGRYGYDFGDGWRASVTVRQVDGKAAAKLRRQSAGFCGYGWMIREIKEHGRILTLQERNAPNASVSISGDEPEYAPGSCSVISLRLRNCNGRLYDIDSETYHKLKASGMLWELYPDAPDVFPSQNANNERQL